MTTGFGHRCHNGQTQAKDIAGLRGFDQPVIPKPRGGIIGIGLFTVLGAHLLFERFLSMYKTNLFLA